MRGILPILPVLVNKNLGGVIFQRGQFNIVANDPKSNFWLDTKVVFLYFLR